MTLVLYIPFKSGAILVSDRLNSLNSGQNMLQDKVIQVSKDTVIGFAGTTEICLNIVDEIQSKNRDLGLFEINNIIKETFYQLRKESRYEIEAEFLIIRKNRKNIQVLQNTNGVGHSVDSLKNHAIGLTTSIIPYLDMAWDNLSLKNAVIFAIDLVGWASRIERGVGEPRTYGCNICTITRKGVTLQTQKVQSSMERMIYRFDAPQGDKKAQAPQGRNQLLHGRTIQIGFISSTTAGLETAVPLINEIIQPDINKFASKLGYDVRFEFLIDDAGGQAAVHLEKIMGFNSMGIKNIIGGGWSSQAQASLGYCNDNDILLISSSSTSPLLGIPDDNFFRTCPTDLIQAPAISRMIESRGIKALVVLQRGDAWADGIYNSFEPVFTSTGGIILEKIRYAGEATEFSSYLGRAETIAKKAVDEFGAEKVGILIISFSEIVVMAVQAEDYPTIYNLTWFGADGTALSRQLCDDAPEQAVHLKIFSTFAAPTESLKFNELSDRYFKLTGQPFGYYSACLYDAAWIIASAILHAQSYNPLDVMPLLHDIASNTFGASGWCKLNEDGDRAICDYQIWGYEKNIDGTVKPKVFGYYNGTNRNVMWY